MTGGRDINQTSEGPKIKGNTGCVINDEMTNYTVSEVLVDDVAI